MIATLTPNPALDQTVWLERLETGEVNRVRETHLDAAGKGVNVSRMIHRLGWPTIALGFLAGETGSMVERALEQEGVQYHFVRVPGQTRVNVTIVEECGKATSLYAPGPVVPPDRFEMLLDLVHVWLQPGTVLVLAGSLPEGVASDAYAELVTRAHEHGARVIVDASGEPLARALQARPDLVKPNVAEAERLVGRRLDSRDAVVGAAREIAAMGARTVVLSMGAEGAVCTNDGGSWFVRSPSVTRRSTVGSGDAMVAGLAIALAKDAPKEYALRLGAAAGAASAMAEGTALGSATDVQALLPRVEIENIA